MDNDRPAFEDQLKLAQKESVACELAKSPTVDRLTDIGIDAMETVDTLVKRFYATGPSEGQPACTEGCTFCCHQYVGLTVPELAVLAKYITSNFSSAEKRDLKVRLSKVVHATRGMKRFERAVAKLDCPLLGENTRRCTVYAARPLTCRGMHSLSRAACEANDTAPGKIEPIPQYAAHKSIVRSISVGMQLALAEHGAAVSELELAEALRLVLAEPELFERWMNGERVFDSAHMPPV